MLDKMVIRDVIFHTLASFIFGVWTLWGCHRRVETGRNSKRLHACLS